MRDNTDGEDGIDVLTPKNRVGSLEPSNQEMSHNLEDKEKGAHSFTEGSNDHTISQSFQEETFKSQPSVTEESQEELWAKAFDEMERAIVYEETDYTANVRKQFTITRKPKKV